MPNCGRRQNKLLHSDFSKKEAATETENATAAVATIITQRGLQLVRLKLVNGNHSLSVLDMCDTAASISFLDKSIVSTLHLQGRKASLCVAEIHESQDVKTELVLIAVSAHEKSRPLTTMQNYVHENLKLGDQVVDLQEFATHI